MTLNLPRRALPLVLAGLAAGALATACGGETSTDGTATPKSSPGTSVTIPAGAAEIDQDNLAFKPDKVTVKAAERVYFSNSETAIHTVTIDGKNISGTMKKGDIVVWTAPNAGTFKVTCDFHPQMKATITVQ